MIYRLKLEHKARTLFLINSFPPNSLMTSDTQCFSPRKECARNSEGSRGDMYGEACCESCPVTHLVQLWRIILLPDFTPDRFLDLSSPDDS